MSSVLATVSVWFGSSLGHFGDTAKYTEHVCSSVELRGLASGCYLGADPEFTSGWAPIRYQYSANHRLMLQIMILYLHMSIHILQ